MHTADTNEPSRYGASHEAVGLATVAVVIAWVKILPAVPWLALESVSVLVVVGAFGLTRLRADCDE